VSKEPKPPRPDNPSGPKAIVRISEAAVATRFTDDVLDQLATACAELTAEPERKRFALAVREATIAYARFAFVSPNDVHDEIAELGKAADGGQYREAAELLERLSETALRFLRLRADNLNLASRMSAETRDLQRVEVRGRNGEILSRSSPNKLRPTVAVPTADELRDPPRQAQACATLATLCRTGVDIAYPTKLKNALKAFDVEFAKVLGATPPLPHRPELTPALKASEVEFSKMLSGRRKIVSTTIPFAPEKTRTPPRRLPEYYYVVLLRSVWFEFKGKWPGVDVNRESKTPFVEMVEECFRLAGAPRSTAVNIIRELNVRRKSRATPF
jgi:hypothetical protein